MITKINNSILLSQLAKLEKKLFGDSAYDDKQLEAMMRDEKYMILAEIEEEILGYIIIYQNLDYYEIFKIGVDEKKQKMGYGTKLINYIKQIVNIKKIYLEVNCKNKKAINFYKKNNFLQNGIRKNYYGKEEDAILMEWSDDS